MSFKFLIDECLSPELVEAAVLRGHYESTCVRNRGWCGLKDHELIRHVVAEDLTLVTCNSIDFRGQGPGKLAGEHARLDVHAGLVCLNSESGLDLDLQIELFGIALDILDVEPDLINRALDLFHREDGQIDFDLYDIPFGELRLGALSSP
ncbi:DUF5615 family PIN-like protein [Ramlibacter sp.]|uniref:DUF5615 family PIN-like protein n=1 Tax=Ramlibacter sp. TaxID=1917967 RepID=UPI003D0BCF54